MPRKKTTARRKAFRELKADQLRWTCRPAQHKLASARGDPSLIGIIGQDRAIRALKLGIELYGPGYNVFVCGITGTGRSTTVQRILDKIKRSCPAVPDLCYVHNFIKPDEPRLLALPRGCGARLTAEMERFGRELRTDVAGLLDSERHAKRRERIISRYGSEGDDLVEKFESEAEREGFALKRVPDGNLSRLELFPIVSGQAISLHDFHQALAEKKIGQKRGAQIIRHHQNLSQRLEAIARQGRDMMLRMETEVSDLDKSEVRSLLHGRIEAIEQRAAGGGGSEELRTYLAQVLDYVIDNLEQFGRRHPLAAAPEGTSEGTAKAEGPDDVLTRLKVNVVLDAAIHGECPVIIEDHPSYRRLFGYFEKSIDPSGFWSTDYTKIRAGSLLAAHGGYLVVQAEDLFSQRHVWTELKRTLIRRSLSIMEENTGTPTLTMKPQPIPINVKMIMIGQRATYETLLDTEPDFQKIFKVLADFDDEMDLNTSSLRQYAAFVRNICAEEKLADFEAAAIAAVAEYGARAAGHQGKLSTRFGEIADLLREADYWRQQDGGRKVLARHVRSAIDESLRRQSLMEDKLREMIRLEQVLIDIGGERTGQVNVLTVQQTGSHIFGMPARITATTSPGTEGIVSIEREAQLSGKHHTKGVLTIGGLLREKFGSKRPLALTASITFEQSYAGVDGDSASSGEIYALFSALSGLPLRQGIAVTGSVDQKGDIQPVGGINDKIEGFFKVCCIKGLTGEQGVIVPDSNLRDLMLDEAVVEAVRKKKFHIYPVRTIEEGIEILSGVPAGTANPSEYPEGTVFRLVDDRLAQYNEAIKEHASAETP